MTYEFDQWGQWYGTLPVDQLQAPERNARRGDMAVLEESMKALGFYGAVLVRAEDHTVVAGNHRLAEARELGHTEVPCIVMNREQLEARKIALMDNRSQDRAGYDADMLVLEVGELADMGELDGTGWSEDDLADWLATVDADDPSGYGGVGGNLGGGGGGTAGGDTQPGNGALAARFGAPPYSILDSRKGYWQQRKNLWLGLGIRSEVGRDRVLKGLAPANAITSDTLASLAAGSAGGGTVSVFDPMLCELVYRWFLPYTQGARVLDPFAGGSVRGVVAGWLGAEYHGVELRPEQVAANVEQVQALWAGRLPDYTPELTPVEQAGRVWVKREDLYTLGGQQGGKVRSCAAILQAAVDAGAPGVVTAGSRHSPQVAIVAALAARMGLRARCHVPAGDMTPELVQAAACGAELVQHRPGHNSVIVARAREDAAELGWVEVPFGMECQDAVEQTAAQVDADQVGGVRRIVVPVGSGMSLAGILHGLVRQGLEVPVLGVVVGAEPKDRLDQWAPEGWQRMVELVRHPSDYSEHLEGVDVGGIPMDPVYEAKCVEYLEDGDLLWVVGRRLDTTVADQPSHTYRVSAGWAMKRLDCTLDGITREGGCGGSCCRKDNYWPPMANPDPDTTACVHLGDKGCTLAAEDMPVKCLLYPLVPNENGTLVQHYRGRAGTCKPCVDQGPPLIHALRGNLATLVGEAEADRIVATVEAGEDAELVLPPAVAYALDREHQWEAANVVPQPRSQYVPGDLPAVVQSAPSALGQPAGPEPVYYTGDSSVVLGEDGPEDLPGEVDLVFTCPPYADLEVYSDDPADLSTMEYPEFVVELSRILQLSVERLRPNRFAVVVVGEARDSQGAYYGVVPDTIRAMQQVGMAYHGEAILITPGGTLPVRAGRAFNAGRKLGKSHQNVLVFWKGDPREVGQHFDPILQDVEAEALADAAELS